MKTNIFVREIVGLTPYWACGETLPSVRKNFKKFSGKFPSSKASIVSFTGDSELVDKIMIDDMGSINYSQRLTKVELQ